MVNNLTERELKILSYLIDEDDFINETIYRVDSEFQKRRSNERLVV